jgi:hypothetical protein
MAKDHDGRGISLAKGPVLIVGLALLAFGILALLIAGATSFTAKPLSGMVSGKKFIGLEVNGWSSLLFIGAGALLVFGSPLHWGAKLTSIVVGIALIAAAVLAFVDDDSALGIFAANGLTELVWLAAGVVLLVLALLPRVGGRTNDEPRRREEFSAERVVDRESVEGPDRARSTRSHRDTSWDERATR